MKKILALSIFILLTGEFYLSAQNTSSNNKSLNFPTKKYGISIGNSQDFTGIRINFADKNVKKINGLNLTFWFKYCKNLNAVVNGISLGVIPTAGTMQYLNLGLLGVGTNNNLNGFSVGGIVVGSGGNINGLSLSGLITMADGDNSAISGIAVSGIGIGAHKAINGLAVGGFAVGTDGNISGVVSSLAYISCKKEFQGVAFTVGYLESEIFQGVAIAGFTKTNQMHGLSIALYNRTKELHGVQLGLLNYAGNNQKGLRMFPFINFHLKKKVTNDLTNQSIKWPIVE